MAVIKGWRFPVEVDENTGQIKTIEDNKNIKQSVRMILKTQKFERKVVPTFGTDTMPLMFEIIDPNFINKLKHSISSAIKMWEKHAGSLNVVVNATSGPVSTVEVAVDYVTDIEPVQERVVSDLKVNGKD